MTYSELREWFTNWLDSIADEPVPLDISPGEWTNDCRITIDVIITEIDATLKQCNGKPNDRLKRLKNKLIRLKKAIEDGNHDISKYQIII